MVFGGPDYPGSPHIFQKLIKRVKSTDAHVMKLEWPWLLVSLVAQVALVVLVVNKYVSLHVCPLILFLTALFALIILPGSTSPGQHFIISYIGVTRNNSVEDQTDFYRTQVTLVRSMGSSLSE